MRSIYAKDASLSIRTNYPKETCIHVNKRPVYTQKSSFAYLQGKNPCVTAT